MARKNNTDELIHCNVCGEEYSATYRRCPFCGERVDARPAADEEEFDDGYVFDGQALFDDAPADDQASPNKGGKRLANGSNSKPIGKGDRYDPPGQVNWVRIITFGISLVIIIAALIIVFTVFYPMLRTGDEPNPSASTTPSSSQSEAPTPSGSQGPAPSDDPSPSPSAPVSDGISAYITGASGGLRVRSGPGTTYDVLATLRNGDEVTVLEALDNGWYKISYVGAGGADALGYVKSDYVAIQNDPAPSPSASSQPSDDPAPSGELKAGAAGKITGAAKGLRVRSGPGTTYEHQASLRNGDKITIVEDAGNGWYKITYSGSDGKDTTGYIMGEYIDVD